MPERIYILSKFEFVEKIHSNVTNNYTFTCIVKDSFSENYTVIVKIMTKRNILNTMCPTVKP